MKILILLLICHYLCDFTPLSTPWMLQAKQYGKPFFPILVHAFIHAFGMFLVLLIFIDYALAFKLGVMQWTAHFLIDVWKGRMNKWFPILEDNTKKYYWMIFGFDQLLHELVIVAMISYIYCF